MTEMIGYGAMIIMGILLGMVGSGGSFFAVPILVYLFGLHPLLAATYSLLIVGSTALIAGVRYTMEGAVHGKTAFYFTIPGLIGMYVARQVALPALPDPIFSGGFLTLGKGTLVMAVFALLMIMAALALFRSRLLRAESHSRFPPIFTLLIQGTCVGFITGFTGIGAGFIIVPVLVHMIDLPVRTATGTSLLVIAVTALAGFALSYFTGYFGAVPIDYVFVGMLLGSVLVGLAAGIMLSKIILEDTLKMTLAVIVLLVGLVVFFDQIRTLFAGS